MGRPKALLSVRRAEHRRRLSAFRGGVADVIVVGVRMTPRTREVKAGHGCSSPNPASEGRSSLLAGLNAAKPPGVRDAVDAAHPCLTPSARS
jgi:hypothetical protein